MARGKKTGGGSRKGSPNKVTREVREAFRLLLEGNVHHMNGWLQKVAKDDPAKALELMGKLADYVIPRLARTELTGQNGKELPGLVYLPPKDGSDTR